MDNKFLHSKTQGAYKPVRVGRPQPDDNWPYRDRPNTPFDPQYGVKNPKFERHLFVRRDQILSDIDSQLIMMSKMRRKDDGTEDDTFTNATSQFESQFNRWVNKHIGTAKSVMSAFLLEHYSPTQMNEVKEGEEEDITLLMPAEWDDTVFEQLCDAVHDYIVNATLYEYFVISLTSKDPVTVDKMDMRDNARKDIKKYVNATKPDTIHKKQSPF